MVQSTLANLNSQRTENLFEFHDVKLTEAALMDNVDRAYVWIKRQLKLGKFELKIKNVHCI